uniref:NADH-ubiquinone oxidoreductase chain 1 n=2 Tax=Amynthas moniliatus TaxID=1402133 RepID=A0A142AG86_9ANNE|nr:NADH dehydrogenase subunit 1 [Amynthas moniliatus]AMO27097.1 NADH dehydrogenase subunit 1 [Amynthas moniliatus]QFZ89588.1 NADH dehydrogenase subunit 1 [Amynthas moniliatus moniliatus]
MSITFFTSILLSLIMALVAMAFYTLMERKFLGYFHLRKGPNKVGLMGISQPFSDAIKLFVKEQAKPTPANKSPFMVAPTMGLILALMMWAIYPHSHQSFFLQFSVLYFLCVSSMNVYATFMAGWSSNSKYALLGALRGVAQTISYEVSMSLILLSALVLVMTMDFTKMVSYSWMLMMLMPLTVTWFITNLAETNRTPFDFAEGESELVSGFNIEYSSGLFAMIFMAEYMNILVMSLFTSIIFMSMPNMIMSDMMLLLKTLLLAMLFVWVRATFPRMRYDHLMNLTWKSFLPLSLTTLMLVLPITMLM